MGGKKSEIDVKEKILKSSLRKSGATGCKIVGKSAKNERPRNRVSREENRLNDIFRDLEPGKLKTADTLIKRAAFITVSLEDLEAELWEKGWTEEYQNGQNQSGIKRSAAADTHIALTKNLSAIMKQLLELVPPDRKNDKFKELFGDDSG